MKIAIFTNNYKPIISGVTESVESFREGLEKRGHKVYVFAPNFPGHKDEDPNVFRFPSIDFRYKTAFPIAITRSPRIYKKIKELNIDIIHCQHPFNVGKAGLRYGKRLGIPIVFTNHTRYDIYTHFIPLFPQKFLKWYVKNASVRFANKCNVVIAPTQSIKEMLRKKWGMKTKIEVIPTGIRPGQFINVERREEIRKKFNIKDDELLLITITRLAAEKSVDFLIRAFSQISKLEKNKSRRCASPVVRERYKASDCDKKIKFMIVGDGSDRENLEKITADLKLSDKIIFAGSVPHKDIAKYFKAGDIFIYSSLSETQGIMTSEAMASEIPVVAVKAPGAMDIIEDGVDGILSENIESEFVKKVQMLIDDKELRKKISKNAIKKAQEYSIEKSTEKMIKVYEKVQSSNEN